MTYKRVLISGLGWASPRCLSHAPKPRCTVPRGCEALGGEDGRLAGLGTWRWQALYTPRLFGGRNWVPAGAADAPWLWGRWFQVVDYMALQED